MAREESEDNEFWGFVVQVQAFVILLIVIVIALVHYSREFRDLLFFRFFIIDEQIQRFRRLVAGQ